MKKRIILTNVYIMFLLLSSMLVFGVGEVVEVEVRGKGIALCTPGELRCNGRIIEKCAESGSDRKTIEKCDFNCKLDSSGKPFCSKDGGDGGKIKYIIILGFIIFLIWLSRKFGNKKIYFYKQQKGEIKEKWMYCKHCGSKASKNSKFCNECGKKL